VGDIISSKIETALLKISQALQSRKRAIENAFGIMAALARLL
jgi:hypothetical protein